MAVNTDVAVIGGGAVGLCTARELQTRGRQVMVIERGNFGGQCSTGNAGLVVPSHIMPLAAPGVVGQGLRWLMRRDSPFRIKPRLDLTLMRWLWSFYTSCTERHVEHAIPLLRDLNLESRALYADWAEQATGTGLGFRSSGLLMLHKTEKGRTKDLKDAEYAQKAGLDIRVLDAGEVHDHTFHLPPSVQGGVYYAQDGLVDPTRVIDALTHELGEQGATLRPEVAVTGFDHSHGSIQRIQTTDGVVEADKVVLAAGSWSAPLSEQLGLDVPIQPAKGYSVTYDVPNGRPGAPYILTEEKVSVTPMGERVRFAGTLELAGFDASVDPYRLAPILDVANEYPLRGGPTSPSTAEPWVGFRPCTPDGLPIIGPVSAYDNLMLATGHGMMGVSLAPITGRLVAEVLNEESPSMDIEPLRLQRFH